MRPRRDETPRLSSDAMGEGEAKKGKNVNQFYIYSLLAGVRGGKKKREGGRNREGSISTRTA